MNKRLISAMAAYAVIATLAAFTLDGVLRVAVWILMAGLAAKTWIAYKAGWGFSALHRLAYISTFESRKSGALM